MKKLLIYCLFLLPFALIAQEPEREEPTMGMAFLGYGHSHGLGGELQFWKQNDDSQLIFGLDLASIKDRREQKVISFYQDQGGKKYIFDKKNHFYSLRPTIGISKPLFKRSFLNKIDVKYRVSAGPAIGFAKPYYVEVAVPINPTQAIVEEHPFDANEHSYFDIVGPGDYFLGFNEMQIIPGAHAKATAVLDFSSSINFVRAVEFGAFADYYIKKVEILDSREDRQLFVGFMLGFSIGNTF